MHRLGCGLVLLVGVSWGAVSQGRAEPSLFGYTGLVFAPTAETLPRNRFNASWQVDTDESKGRTFFGRVAGGTRAYLVAGAPLWRPERRQREKADVQVALGHLGFIAGRGRSNLFAGLELQLVHPLGIFSEVFTTTTIWAPGWWSYAASRLKGRSSTCVTPTWSSD